jgi:hypothetical protein
MPFASSCGFRHPPGSGAIRYRGAPDPLRVLAGRRAREPAAAHRLDADLLGAGICESTSNHDKLLLLLDRVRSSQSGHPDHRLCPVEPTAGRRRERPPHDLHRPAGYCSQIDAERAHTYARAFKAVGQAFHSRDRCRGGRRAAGSRLRRVGSGAAAGVRAPLAALPAPRHGRGRFPHVRYLGGICGLGTSRTLKAVVERTPHLLKSRVSSRFFPPIREG